MAEKHLTEAAWKSFAAGRGYKDAPLLKALVDFGRAEQPDEQQTALDTLDKQSDALAKSNKGDKELAGYVAEIGKASARARKVAEQAATQAKDAGGDDEDSPALLTTKLIPLIRQVRGGGDAVFAMVASTGKAAAVLMLRKEIGPARRKLLADYLGQSGGVKYFGGQCMLENNAVTFVLQGSVAGMAKRLKAALLQQTGLNLKVRCRGDDGEDDDGEPGDDAAALLPTGQTGDVQAPPSPGLQGYQQRRAALQEKLDEALAAKHPEATKMRAVSGFADEKAEAGDFVGAGKALDMLEKLLSVPASGPTGTNPALDSALAAWLAARNAVLMQLKTVADDLTQDRAEDPDDDFLRDAEVQVKAVMKQLTAEPRTGQQVRELETWLSNDDVVADVDTYFGNIRAPLATALSGVSRALGTAA